MAPGWLAKRVTARPTNPGVRQRHVASKRRAVTVAEFALVAPLVFLLIFGFMEGTRILSAWLILNNESREAARVASVAAGQVANPAAHACTTAITRASEMLDGTRLSCTPQSTYDANGDLIEMTITLRYSVDLVIPLVVPVYKVDPFPIAARATVRPE
jgi:Flp pilus assembly protein TadG